MVSQGHFMKKLILIFTLLFIASKGFAKAPADESQTTQDLKSEVRTYVETSDLEELAKRLRKAQRRLGLNKSIRVRPGSVYIEMDRQEAEEELTDAIIEIRNRKRK